MFKGFPFLIMYTVFFGKEIRANPSQKCADCEEKKENPGYIVGTACIIDGGNKPSESPICVKLFAIP